MTIDQIEENFRKLFKSQVSEETFIFDFLLSYGLPKSSISRLKKGDYNLSKNSGEIIWKKKIFFQVEKNSDLHHLIDDLKKDNRIIKNHPRFIIVTDFKILLSIDSNIDDHLDIPFNDMPRHFDFFLPLAGIEKAQLQKENLADRKAAEKMARLYDLILEDNSLENPKAIHSLNVFLSRLLFCFFAEDTGIFEKNKFTNSIKSHTTEDGSDLSSYLNRIFQVLNEEKTSPETPKFLKSFPYVNGGLFKEKNPIPKFSRKSRKIIIECGSLNWKDINPDIFGSMIQAAVQHSQRGSLGIHYTSVENIMKVIKPLFLDNLYDEFERAGDNKKKLSKLLYRLRHLKIFDPACGSGNFLIIAYKELCKLEIKILKKRDLDRGQVKLVGFQRKDFGCIELNQFYGIEIDDFAHETAKLSLHIAEHQVNLKFKEIFGETKPTLPLGKGGNIICGNATRLEWEKVCPKDKDSEIYILGNPPYLGSSYQNKEQKDDLMSVAKKLEKYRNLDYISCWFIKATTYIRSSLNISVGFVSTNSICQGEQVALLWPYLFSQNVEIHFAHQSFKWTNNAKRNAGVTCVIIGIKNSSKTNGKKILYNGNIAKNVKNINSYLIDASSVSIKRQRNIFSSFPIMLKGNQPTDGGNLVLSKHERDRSIKEFPESEKFIRKYIGSREFLNGLDRWCLWIQDSDVKTAMDIPFIKERINKVKEMRLSSETTSTKKAATSSYKFIQIQDSGKKSLIIPKVSSERRNYIPIGFLDETAIVSDLAFAIYDYETYLFSVISSRMHMTWVRTVAGRLETRLRYSSDLCYNTFPFPEITDAQKKTLEDCVFEILDEREKHSEKTLSQLYDPDKMPEGLKEAHTKNDRAIDRCYRRKPFSSDDERLEYLFKLYEEMLGKEEKQKKK